MTNLCMSENTKHAGASCVERFGPWVPCRGPTWEWGAAALERLAQTTRALVFLFEVFQRDEGEGYARGIYRDKT